MAKTKPQLKGFVIAAVAFVLALSALAVGGVDYLYSHYRLAPRITEVKTSNALDIYNLSKTVQGKQDKPVFGPLERVSGPDIIALGATNKIPTAVALFETSLASSITSAATSMTLVSAKDKDGNTLASSTYAFILDEGTASEEMVIADCTGTACANMARGISALTGTSSVTSLKKAHRRGASVKITDGPQLLIISRLLNGIDTFPNILSYGSHPTFTSNAQIIDKQYADDLVIAGGAVGTFDTAGIFKTASGLDMASSTDSRATYNLVLTSDFSTSTPGVNATTTIPITQFNGKLHQNFWDLTANYTWTGTQIVSGTNSFTGNTYVKNLNASSTSANPIVLNGVSLNTPSTQGASSTSLQNDGSGNLTWNGETWGELLAASSTPIATSTMTLTIPTRRDLRIVVDIPGSASDLPLLRFNLDNGANYGSGWIGYTTTDRQVATQIVLGDENSSTTARYFDIRVKNQATIAKRVTYTGIINAGTPATYAGKAVTGSGIWNNTSAQITSVSIQMGTLTNTLNANTSVAIYGSRD